MCGVWGAGVQGHLVGSGAWLLCALETGFVEIIPRCYFLHHRMCCVAAATAAAAPAGAAAHVLLPLLSAGAIMVSLPPGQPSVQPSSCTSMSLPCGWWPSLATPSTRVWQSTHSCWHGEQQHWCWFCWSAQQGPAATVGLGFAAATVPCAVTAVVRRAP